jgi:hypothetical protein
MDWYLSLTRGKQIFIAVVLAHLFSLAMLGADHWMHRVRVHHKKVSVNTFVVAPPPKPVTSESGAVIVKPKATAKKVQPKKVINSSKASTNKEVTLLADIEKNLKDLATPTSPAKKTNIEIPNFHSVEQVNEIDSTTPEQIAAFLQEALELPEFGEVKIKLSINRFGALETLEILESKSLKNEAFLKKRLPELQFPRLNEVVSLTIVFMNF